MGGKEGRGRGAVAVGRDLDWESSSNPLTLATSLEFLRLCLSVGIVKLCVKLLLQFSNICFDGVPKVEPYVLSVKGELWRASHRKEEEEDEEERSGGRLVSKKPVLSRLDGLMMNPTKSQIRRIQSVMANPDKPPRRSEGVRNQEAPKIAAPIEPEDDTSVADILRNCLQADASRGTSSTIR